MALYTIQDFITIAYAQIDAIVAYNGVTPNPYVQYKCAVAIVQALMTQDIIKIKTK